MRSGSSTAGTRSTRSDARGSGGSLTRSGRDSESIRRRFADFQRTNATASRTRGDGTARRGSGGRSGGDGRGSGSRGDGDRRGGPGGGLADGRRSHTGQGRGDGHHGSGRHDGDRHGSGRHGGGRHHGDRHHGGHKHHHKDKYHHKDKHRHHHYYSYKYRPYWWAGFVWYGLDRLYSRPYYSGYYYEPYYYGTTSYVEPYAVYDVPAAGAAVPTEPAEAYAQQEGDESERFLIAAEDAFRAARYEQATRELQHALVELPGDGRAMLFMSQTLLATGKYQQAVGAAYQGMSLLDEKDWGFVAENYDKYYGNDDYVAQVQKLGEYIKENPDAAYAYALRGYHWGFLDYPEAARKDLKKAVELEPRDQMAAKLLVKFGGKAPEVKPEKKPDLPQAEEKAPLLPPPPEGEPE